MGLMRTRDDWIGRDEPMPGDDIVPDAAVVMDRERVLPAPARDVWPWIVQLGKDRAGWYMPRWVDWVFIPRHRRAVRGVDDPGQAFAPRPPIPGWGSGGPPVPVGPIGAPPALGFQSSPPPKPPRGQAPPHPRPPSAARP